MISRTLLPLILLVAPLAAQGAPTLRTRWAEQVSPRAPLPEYPRPQLSRERWTNLDGAWTNLNGRWGYAVTAQGADRPTSWNDSIVVPFPIESQLSGVQQAVRADQRLWYRRHFARPSLRPGGRLLLHFGAVDWQATVWVNGTQVGVHEGGFDPFTFDITDALTGAASQEIVVAVWDPTDSGSQPRGKQVLKPSGIWYTAVTGIWQTVWLEPVSAVHIAGLVVTPDFDRRVVRVRATTWPGHSADELKIAIERPQGGYDSPTSGLASTEVVVPIPDMIPWSPDNPHLYTMRITLHRNNVGFDQVESRFGMRKISLGKDTKGVTRLFLNNQPLFQYGTLDQGWWPDGLFTPPTDAAMVYDIATTKALGFNMIRKHVKVEPARWYHLADSIGLLVWQDMPSADNKTPVSQTAFASELQRMVAALRSFTSIVMWVPFNEGWGQHDTEKTVAWLKGYDTSRLVNNASGWTDKQVGDVSDVHAYPGPGMPALEANRAAVLGEFGGLGLPLAGHTWLAKDNWGYKSYPDSITLGAAYADLMHQLKLLIADGLSAAVYTQTSDVEIEVNGLMTYDRALIKLPAKAIASAKQLFTAPATIRNVVPTSLTSGQRWRYTTTAPAANWFANNFNDRRWLKGEGGFGRAGTPSAVIRTGWTSSDLWLRRSFTLTSTALVAPHWRIHHDEDAEVYLNGTLVATFSGYTSGYLRMPLDAAARAALRVGTNTLAVHVHQTRGGQYLDLGIDEVILP